MESSEIPVKTTKPKNFVKNVAEFDVHIAVSSLKEGKPVTRALADTIIALLGNLDTCTLFFEREGYQLIVQRFQNIKNASSSLVVEGAFKGSKGSNSKFKQFFPGIITNEDMLSRFTEIAEVLRILSSSIHHNSVFDAFFVNQERRNEMSSILSEILVTSRKVPMLKVFPLYPLLD